MTPTKPLDPVEVLKLLQELWQAQIQLGHDNIGKVPYELRVIVRQAITQAETERRG